MSSPTSETARLTVRQQIARCAKDVVDEWNLLEALDL